MTESGIFETCFDIDPLGEEDIIGALKVVEQRHPLSTLALEDSLYCFHFCRRCCFDCVSTRRLSGKAPKKVEDWLKKRAAERHTLSYFSAAERK